MSPILGIIASQNYPRITNSYESIQTVTVSTAVSSITFSSIPSTYKHLQIRGIAKWGTAYTGYSRIQFNSDTGANYTQHRLEGSGSAASAAGYTGETSSILGFNSDTQWGANVTDILDYTNTNKYTTIRTLGGFDANGSGYIAFSSGLWLNTAAITSIVLQPSNGVTFVQYSQFALYGIKG